MNLRFRLSEKVRQFLARYGVAPDGTVVAVSGGPDSVALLRVLLHLRAGRLVVAHLNHQLRGAESDADEAFVRDLHAQLKPNFPELEVRCARADLAAQAKAERANLESVARRVRYGWLTDVAREAGCRWVATGHTADDQAETVLHRLLRGTGLKGLRGIAARRELGPGIQLIRPLLHVSRQEVLAYLEAEGQSFCRDSSNLDPRFTRNRIRHELLPLLARDYNPAIAAVLGRLAEQAEEVYRGMEGLAAKLLAEAELPRAGSLLVFDRQRLAAASRHLAREVFGLVWAREGWPAGRMGFGEWDRLAGLAFGETVAVDLPGGVHARGLERVVQVGWTR